jgi:hypothetical protein
MAFSQQTYQGQGIVQPTERSRVGELLGAGIAGFGASLGEGIRKFSERKEEMKRREQFKKGTVTALTALGADADLLKGMEASELAAYAQMYPQIAAQREKEEAQGFYSDMLRAFQPQQVQRDFGPEITAAEQRLIQAQQGGFRPEFTYPDSQQEMPESVRSFAGQPSSDQSQKYDPFRGYVFSSPFASSPQAPQPQGRSPEIEMREEMRAMRRGGGFGTRQTADTTTPSPEPQPQRPMGPEPALEPSPEVQQAARDLDILRIQAAEGDTRLETSKEVMRRVSENIPELAEKYPTQAKNLYEMLYAKQDKLTPSEQIAMMKLQREVQASEVAGYGVAPSVQIAQDFREFAIPTQEGIEKIQELIDIAKQGLSGKLNPTNRQRATSIQKRLMGELKEQIVGVGAVSAGEWEILATVIPDVTKIMSFSDVNIKVLKELQSDLKGKLKNRANAISWSPLQGGTGQAQGPMGKTFTYGMSGQLESR